GIRAAAAAARRIPVIGNGDVTTPEAAKRMIDQTGVAGVSIGRGAFYNPWIFKATDHFLRTGEVLPDPSFDERIRVMTRHFDRMIEVFGETHGCRMFRKVGPWYSKRFGPANFFNKRVVTIATAAEYHQLIAEYRKWREPFLDGQGELLPQYRSQAAQALFHEDLDGQPAVAARREIPVPEGPVDLW
ncbi:tRNA-dihydrouridine synthase, partial [Kamptonema cortianum]|nr:tRNA-dihydrouridine synthase [Kamptonema cortianum]